MEIFANGCVVKREEGQKNRAKIPFYYLLSKLLLGTLVIRFILESEGRDAQKISIEDIIATIPSVFARDGRREI